MAAELTIRDPAATVVRDVTAWLRLVAIGPYALLAALTAYTAAQRRGAPG
ncbi:sensor histidine kinase, partial [Frankia sp. AgB1.8]|nr:sensor histidine kinase [Frankia sp. AgB1.8]